jgi:hypothetical protein
MPIRESEIGCQRCGRVRVGGAGRSPRILWVTARRWRLPDTARCDRLRFGAATLHGLGMVGARYDQLVVLERR